MPDRTHVGVAARDEPDVTLNSSVMPSNFVQPYRFVDVIGWRFLLRNCARIISRENASCHVIRFEMRPGMITEPLLMISSYSAVNDGA